MVAKGGFAVDGRSPSARSSWLSIGEGVELRAAAWRSGLHGPAL